MVKIGLAFSEQILLRGSILQNVTFDVSEEVFDYWHQIACEVDDQRSEADIKVKIYTIGVLNVIPHIIYFS